MCAILDANSIHEIFQPDKFEAGREFLKWIDSGKGTLMTGGKAYQEFQAGLSAKGRNWAQQAQLSGKLQIVNEDQVKKLTEKIKTSASYRSDDPHILALAQVSGARLLYSNDIDLQRDFRDKALIDNPRGKVYSTREGKEFKDSHRKLLANRALCS